MSLYDYKESQQISRTNPAFYALIMAAFRCADTVNAEKLKRAFPEVFEEMKKRYDAPGGVLPFEAER